MIRMIAGSWLLENEPLPYILLSKLVTTPSENYSCLDRLEEHSFRFTIYSRESAEVEAIINELEGIYDFSNLNLIGKIFNGRLIESTCQTISLKF